MPAFKSTILKIDKSLIQVRSRKALAYGRTQGTDMCLEVDAKLHEKSINWKRQAHKLVKNCKAVHFVCALQRLPTFRFRALTNSANILYRHVFF